MGVVKVEQGVASRSHTHHPRYFMPNSVVGGWVGALEEYARLTFAKGQRCPTPATGLIPGLTWNQASWSNQIPTASINLI